METNDFSYHKYIQRVDLATLVEPVTLWEEVAQPDSSLTYECFLCRKKEADSEYVRLLNNEHICINCLLTVQSVRYPEKYQREYVDYLIKKEAKRIARDEYSKKHRNIHSAWCNSLNERNETDRVFQKRDWTESAKDFLSGAISFSFVITLFGVFLVESLRVEIALLGGIATLVFSVLTWLAYMRWSYIDKLANQNEMNWIAANPRPINAEEAVAKWDKNTAEIECPELKDFHDPNAELSAHDRLVLKIFDYWPGYPPFWDYLKSVTKDRDGYRCQVSGCPNRTSLHIHHRISMAKGGSHRPENLVTLCEFHHGLQPELGHERIWGKVRTQFYSMVQAHLRSGRPVRAHVRRKELADQKGLDEIIEYYELSCIDCGAKETEVEIVTHNQEVLVRCLSCSSYWSFQRKLLEETGPQMAEFLTIGSNRGTETIDWNLLSSIRKPHYVKSKKKTKLEKSNSASFSKPREQSKTCPLCGKNLKKLTGRYGLFWGCSGFPDCKYTRNLR